MNDSNQKYEVSLYLKGSGLNPEELTTRFGIAPTRSHKKGETWLTSTGKQVVERTGLWVLSVRSSGDLSAALGRLVAMTSRNCSLSELPGIDEAYFDVFVTVDADDDGGGTTEFDMDAASVAAISKFALPVRFTVAIVPE